MCFLFYFAQHGKPAWRGVAIRKKKKKKTEGSRSIAGMASLVYYYDKV